MCWPPPRIFRIPTPATGSKPGGTCGSSTGHGNWRPRAWRCVASLRSLNASSGASSGRVNGRAFSPQPDFEQPAGQSVNIQGSHSNWVLIWMMHHRVRTGACGLNPETISRTNCTRLWPPPTHELRAAVTARAAYPCAITARPLQPAFWGRTVSAETPPVSPAPSADWPERTAIRCRSECQLQPGEHACQRNVSQNIQATSGNPPVPVNISGAFSKLRSASLETG